MRRTSRIALVFLALFISSAAWAAIPQTLHYSGKLDTGEGAFTGTIDVRFRLYENPVDDVGGIWDEEQAVTVTGGRFQVQLGAITPLPPLNHLALALSLHLAITVKNDQGIFALEDETAKMPILSVPYALLATQATNAATVGGQAPSDFAAATHSHALADLEHPNCTAGQVLSSNGSGWVCASESDPQVSSATIDAVPRWDGTQLGDSVLTVGSNGSVVASGTFIKYADIGSPGPGTRLAWYPLKAAFRAGRLWDDPTTTTVNEDAAWDSANMGQHSVAMGYNTTASGDESMAMGRATTASGYASTAIGKYTTASHKFSTAMGYSTTASGYGSTAMGQETNAIETRATAMGFYTTASGNSSTAMGSSTTASGVVSTAMGTSTTASGNHSTAMGSGTLASGEGSTAMGAGTTASGDYSTAMGHTITVAAGAHRSIGIGLADSDVYSPSLWPEITSPNTMAIMGGNVGIGTVSPSVALEVDGTVQATKVQADGLIHGDGGRGTVTRNVVQFHTGTQGNDYYHLQMPDAFDKDNGESHMFRIHVRGYAFQTGEIIDLIFAGYNTPSGNGGPLTKTTILDVAGTCDAPTMYHSSSNNHLYLRFRTGSTYYTSFSVDSMYVGNGMVLQPGDITVTVSASNL